MIAALLDSARGACLAWLGNHVLGGRMTGALLNGHFFDSFDEAQRNGPGLRFSGNTKYRLRVTESRTHSDITVRVEWCRQQQGPPAAADDVSPKAYVFVQGGTVYEVKARIWNASDATVLLVLALAGRTGDP